MSNKSKSAKDNPDNLPEVKEEESKQLPAAFDYGEDVGVGYEEVSNEDFAIPFLSVLQALSPQVGGENPIEGAKAGMLYNTVTEELIDGKQGLEFVPAHRDHCFIEWVPRDKGGGFVARHDITSDVVTKAKQDATSFGQYKTPDGNDLVETFYLYGVAIKPEGDVEPVVIGFTSTKIKVYKKFMTRVNMFQLNQGGRKIQPPLFAHRVKLTTASEKNNKGQFHNFALSSAEGSLKDSLLPPDDERFMAAKQLRDLVVSGQARAAHESQDAAGGTNPQEEGEEAPF